jgi:hypothetical protein
MKASPLGARLRQLDLYALLEVAPDAGTEDIRRAYRKAAFRCHPDHNPDDQEAAERFVLLTQARDILLSERGRRAYDEMRERHGMDGSEAPPVEGEGPRTRRRGVRAVWAKDPLSEHQLADRAKKSRSGAELSALWRIGTIVVRAAILRNPHCPVLLFNDPHIAEHWMLSLEAAKRAQCPPDVLGRLAQSFERVVALAVAKNPNTPVDGLACIAVHHRDLEILQAVAAHAHAGPEVLRDLGRAVRGVRSLSLGVALLANPACPRDVEERVRTRLGDMVA